MDKYTHGHMDMDMDMDMGKLIVWRSNLCAS